MTFLIDTNVAIHLRDLNDGVTARVGALGEIPRLSVISCVELEGGVYHDPALAASRRARLDAILAEMAAIPFDTAALAAYAKIVEACGYSRRLILDRMIAATALAHDLTLITMNGSDFTDIPGLKLDSWASPAA